MGETRGLRTAAQGPGTMAGAVQGLEGVDAAQGVDVAADAQGPGERAAFDQSLACAAAEARLPEGSAAVRDLGAASSGQCD